MCVCKKKGIKLFGVGVGVIMRGLMWVLGVEFWFFRRIVNGVNSCVIF